MEYTMIIIVVISLLSTVDVKTVNQLNGIILQSRCRVKCLIILRRRPKISDAIPKLSLNDCLEDKECTACLKPCSQPDLNKVQCIDQCEVETDIKLKVSCSRSCLFLFKVYKIRTGSCPSPEAFSCHLMQCMEDRYCNSGDKCCPVRDGCNICTKTVNTLKGIPEIPNRPKIKVNQATIKIYWTTGKWMQGPIIFVLQSRESEHQFIEREDESIEETIAWKITSQLTETSQIIRDLQPGIFYQYRVLAISLNGSLGPSNNSEIFHLPTDKTPPLPPRNVQLGTTIGDRNTLNITIIWSMPHIKVFRYKITCSKENSGNKTILRKTVNGTTFLVTFSKLEPLTNYKIMVQAIIKYGSKKIKSKRSSLTLKTKAIVKVQSYGKNQTLSDEMDKALKPADISSIHLSEVYQLLNGSLCADISWTRPISLFSDKVAIDKVQIEWRPSACHAGNYSTNFSSFRVITKQTTFNIHSIQHQCKIYKILIWPISRNGITGNIIEKYLQFKDICLNCKDELNIRSIREDGPSNLKYIFKEKNKRGQKVKLMWTPAIRNVINYRLEWTIEGVDTYVKLLPKNSVSFMMNNVIEGAKYDVRVWALIAKHGGEKPIFAGRTTSIHFRVKRLITSAATGLPILTHRQTTVLIEIENKPLQINTTSSVDWIHNIRYGFVILTWSVMIYQHIQ